MLADEEDHYPSSEAGDSQRIEALPVVKFLKSMKLADCATNSFVFLR